MIDYTNLDRLRDTSIPLENQTLLRAKVVSALLVITSFFYFFSLASYLKPQIYVLLDRVTYSTIFENKYIFGYHIDTLIIIIGISLMILFSSKGRIRLIICILS